MNSVPFSGYWFVLSAIVHLLVIVRALAVRDREPASRAAWILILIFLPVVGIIAYLLFGEPWVAHRFRRRAGSVTVELDAKPCPGSDSVLDEVPDRFHAAFRTCQSLSDSPPTGGNQASLAQDSNAAIDAMVKDFDEARHTIHLSFYIWLADRNGLKVVEALQRAASRGVICRVLADGIGSRALIRSKHWPAMKKAGVKLCTSMKLSLGLVFVLGNRVDLRNHRKIVVIDNHITYCGSQNCADPEFLIKARYAPWVDIMLRFQGPVAAQNQRLFAADWMLEAGEDICSPAVEPPPPAAGDGFVAAAFGTGPMSPKGAMSDVFVSLLYSAEREVVISTPYFVPDPPLLAALSCCARRGVQTTLILPARNDSWVVSAISKAYYPQLIEAGVRIFEFRGGLLHAKTLVADQTVSLVGSTNMDRRSLELNFENNILLGSTDLSQQIRQRQESYLADSSQITRQSIQHRPLLRRLGENVATIFGPVF